MPTFSYPTMSPTLSITIKGPQFENTQDINKKNVLHRTMDNSIYTYLKSSSHQKLTLTFNTKDCDFTAGHDMEYFIGQTYGLDIKYVDHDGNTWIGKILNNPFTMKTESQKPDNRHDIEFTIEFAGVKQ